MFGCTVVALSWHPQIARTAPLSKHLLTTLLHLLLLLSVTSTAAVASVTPASGWCGVMWCSGSGVGRIDQLLCVYPGLH